jgi:hypothetical protein
MAPLSAVNLGSCSEWGVKKLQHPLEINILKYGNNRVSSGNI